MEYWRSRVVVPYIAGLLLTASPVCALSWFSRGNVLIPFRTIHGLIVTRMSLNGKPGKNFIVDTGSFTSMFNASVVDAGGLKTISAQGTVHCFGGDVPVTRVASQTTIFGYGLQINGGAVVSDLGLLQNAVRIPLTGIIGSDAITSRPILVDYQAGKITMFPGKHMPHLEKPAERIQLESPPAGAEKFPGPVFAAQVQLPDGRWVKANLEIDTGSDGGLLLYAPFASKYGLIPADPRLTVIHYGCGGKYGLAPVSLPAIMLGSQKITNPETLSAEKAVGAAAATTVDGSIGYRILSRFRIFIDAPDHFVVFEPVKQN